MSEKNKIDVKYLQTVVLRESENNPIQELDSNLYSSISKFVGSLKSEEFDGVEAKIKNTLVDMVTELTSFLLKLRLEKRNGRKNRNNTFQNIEWKI